ncbi:hypothetical protein PDJAM_G00031330 [Pangasius djambal]|uniref:Uncharacterized protein n=1 Tax=Pangasius djambal TaxID=1691987 RepID=A0ACC5YQP8_9TELE|nr:hypothetical protein [Pangasius djambal]
MDNPTSWRTWLPWAEYAHNTLQLSATRLSPFQCQFGFQPPLFPEQEEDAGVPSVGQYVRRCRKTWNKVVRRVNPVAYRLQLPRTLRINPTFHVSLLRPVLTFSYVPAPGIPRLPSSSRVRPCSLCAACWTPAGSVAGFNIWWTGRAMALRSAVGSPPGTFWTKIFVGTSIWPILSALGTSGDAP